MYTPAIKVKAAEVGTCLLFELHLVTSVCSTSHLTCIWHSNIIRHDWPGHWRSLLHQDCQISESQFGTQQDISQMCLQLAGCSQHHPLTWNVSWAGDNLLAFLLSHHKNPKRGTALLWMSCTHLWSRFRVADQNKKSHFWGILFTLLVLALLSYRLSVNAKLSFSSLVGAAIPGW